MAFGFLSPLSTLLISFILLSAQLKCYLTASQGSQGHYLYFIDEDIEAQRE